MSSRILLIEDEPAIADAVAYALQDAGFEVDAIGDGTEALEASRQRDYDLMILDLVLPGMSGLQVCVNHHAATIADPVLQLTPSEFRLLALLATEPGRVFTREELVRHLWQSDFLGDRRAIDVHISNLRRKLEPNPRQPERLVTVRGTGYKLMAV